MRLYLFVLYELFSLSRMITVIIMREDTICQKASNSRFYLTLATHNTLNFKEIFKSITLYAETKSLR